MNKDGNNSIEYTKSHEYLKNSSITTTENAEPLPKIF